MAAADNPAGEGEGLVAVVSLPPGHTTLSFMDQARHQIRNFVQKYKRFDGKPEMSAEMRGYHEFLEPFLPWLETDAVMTPTIREKSKIDLGLRLMADPNNKCPPDIASRAKRILEKFEDDQWGGENRPESEADEPISPSVAPARPRSRKAAGPITSANMYVLARPPPPSHPIWGLEGIMHGFIIQPSEARKFNYVLNPRYEAEKRNFKVFGHNGLTPGDWWPYQKVALFHGAHGHSMAGISGEKEQGAWSIVVSGSSKYEDMDRDLGDTIWYSSDQSHDSVNALEVGPRSNMTKSLHASLRNQQPVRVLRSSGKGHYAPSCGIRYDGLYRVVDVAERKNSKGGLFEQFKLQRQADQPPLQEICNTLPMWEQVRDFERVKDGY